MLSRIINYLKLIKTYIQDYLKIILTYANIIINDLY